MSNHQFPTRKVGIAILTGGERSGWPNPWLMQRLLELNSRHELVSKVIINVQPVGAARNQAFQWALDEGVDYLFCFDNDTIPQPDFVDQVVADLDSHPEINMTFLPYHMVSTPNPVPLLCMAWRENGRLVTASSVSPGWREVEWVGGGSMVIKRHVLEKLPANPFPVQGVEEDIRFCAAVKQAGFKIWANVKYFSSHLHTVDLTTFAQAVGNAHRAGVQEGMAVAAGVKVPEGKSSQPQKDIPAHQRLVERYELQELLQGR